MFAEPWRRPFAWIAHIDSRITERQLVGSGGILRVLTAPFTTNLQAMFGSPGMVVYSARIRVLKHSELSDNSYQAFQ